MSDEAKELTHVPGPLAVLARFSKYVLPEPNTGCWFWVGGLSKNGYGQFWLLGRTVSAHRFSYFLFRGSLDDSLVIDHLCRTPSCVNPQHLDLVSQSVNVLRGNGPALTKERKGSKTHCPHGHRYEGRNLIVRENGDRVCRTCKNYKSMMQKRQLRAALN